MPRSLYIAAYDIRSARRLRKALVVLKGYAYGRKKSVCECYLSNGEVRQLLESIHRVINEEDDRFFLIRHDGALKARTCGRGVAPEDPDWFYIG